jgi:antirestriction protein ArdC
MLLIFVKEIIMKNYVTGLAYTGGNLITLMQSNYSDPNFLTYRQATEAGLQVRKGEKGITLKRIVTVKKKDKKGVVKMVRIPKFFTVFNLMQTEPRLVEA